jgi:hypothetical protein
VFDIKEAAISAASSLSLHALLFYKHGQGLRGGSCNYGARQDGGAKLIDQVH